MWAGWKIILNRRALGVHLYVCMYVHICVYMYAWSLLCLLKVTSWTHNKSIFYINPDLERSILYSDYNRHTFLIWFLYLAMHSLSVTRFAFSMLLRVAMVTMKHDDISLGSRFGHLDLQRCHGVECSQSSVPQYPWLLIPALVPVKEARASFSCCISMGMTLMCLEAGTEPVLWEFSAAVSSVSAIGQQDGMLTAHPSEESLVPWGWGRVALTEEEAVSSPIQPRHLC